MQNKHVAVHCLWPRVHLDLVLCARRMYRGRPCGQHTFCSDFIRWHTLELPDRLLCRLLCTEIPHSVQTNIVKLTGQCVSSSRALSPFQLLTRHIPSPPLLTRCPPSRLVVDSNVQASTLQTQQGHLVSVDIGRKNRDRSISPLASAVEIEMDQYLRFRSKTVDRLSSRTGAGRS